MKKDVSLDLSKFKHVESGKGFHRLKHYEGHEITLATDKLSKAHQEALKAMADKAQAKAEAKGDNKLSTDPDKLAAGGKVGYTKENDSMAKGGGSNTGGASVSIGASGKAGTINAPTAASGVAAANAVRSSGAASPYGQVIRVNKAEGGEVERFAEGGIPEALDPNAPTQEAQPLDFVKGLPDVSNEGIQNTSEDMDNRLAQKLDFMKSQGYGDPYSQQDVLNRSDKAKAETDQAAADRAHAAQTSVNPLTSLAQSKQAHGLPLSPEEQKALSPGQVPQAEQPVNMQPDAGIQGAAQQAGAVEQPKAGGPVNPGDTMGMLQGGYNKQMAGLAGQAQAQVGLAKEQTALLEDQIKHQNEAKAAYQTKFDELNNERQALVKDVQDGHINPEQYWTGDPKTGEGSHSRIMAGIGMLLAGFNPTGRPNAAVDYIQHQMDQNLQAQQKNLDSKNNLLAHNLRQFGNLKDATDMTRVMQADMMSHQLQMAQARAQTPMAQAALQQAQGKLMQDMAPIFQNLNLRQAMMHLSTTSGDPSNTAAIEQMIAMKRSMGDPAGAKDLEDHLVPGVGSNLGKGPVIPDHARQELIAKNDLDTAGRDLMAYSKTHSNIIPGTPEYNYGVTKAMAFQQKIREGLLGTVFRESEKPLLEKFVNENPAGAFKAISTQPQLRAVLDSNAIGVNSIKKMYGLPVSQPQPEAQYKIVNGVKYMRGVDGKAVRVK